MKHLTRLSILTVVIAFIFPSVGIAAPPAETIHDTQLDTVPGSIIRFEHLTIEDGLSQNAGLAIFQDSKGYLWIGTQDGLNRYDGYNFKVYKHDPDNPSSISHNSILAIEEDKDGYLWIGTWDGGLNRFDPTAETFTQYRHDPNEPSSLSDDLVTSIKQDSSGALWVGTLGGLDRYDPVTNAFDHFRNDTNNPDSLSSNAISVIFEDSQHQLWIGTGAIGAEGAGLNRFDPSTGKATRYQHKPSVSRSLSSNNIASIYESPDGMFWIATGGFNLPGRGLNLFDPRTGATKRFLHDPSIPDSLSTNDLITLWGDSSGTLWIGTWTSGLERMELSQPGHFEHYQNDRFFPDSLSGNEIWSLYKDRSGILWVGTSHSGINKLPANSGLFHLYRNVPSKPDSLGTNAVGAFAEDNAGNIWIATWGAGLDRLDLRTGRFEHFRHDPMDPGSLSDDLFMDIFVDSNDIVWAGTMGNGLNSLHPATRRVIHYLHDPEDPASIADNSIAAILPGKGNDLWIGTFGGLSYFDSKTKTFTNYSSDPANPLRLTDNKIVSLYLDAKRNILWIGTWGGGLNRLNLNDPLHTDPQQASFIHYRNSPDNPYSLSEDSVWAIHQTRDGSLWLGTQKGLNHFDPATGIFNHYTEKDGLPNNVVLGIIEDHLGKLWLTTNNGLAQFDPRAKTFIAYDISDGLQSNEFNSNAYYRARSGLMFIGGVNGFNLFDPVDIKPNPFAPQVAVTGFQVFNQPLKVDLSGHEPIELSYKQDFISFEFAAFDFQAPQKNQYAYKLEGFDKDWVQAGYRRYATYTNLPGGHYTFRVKASNSDGVWNETGITIPVSITPPVWQTWWFNGILIVLVAALVVGGFRWRLDTIHKQNILLETQIAERTSELRETNTLLEKEIEQRKRAEAALSKRAASELKLSEARFQAIFDNVAVGVAVMTLERKPIAFNATTERIIGYNAEEMENIDPRSLAVPEDRDMDVKPFQELIEGKRDSYVMERRYRHKDGHIFWARVNYSLVRDLDGKPDYLIGIIEDIDEQKRVAERLAEQEAEYLLTLQQRVTERTQALQETNQRLQEEIEQRARIEKELAEKAADEAVAADRTRLARDLHDAVTQTLFSASLIAEVLPDLWEMDIEEAKNSTEELRQLTRGALAEMRTLLLELRPATLTQTRLSDLIRQLCEAFIGRSRLPITLNIEGERDLPPEVQVAYYRIAQESLNNIFKYARATKVNVTLCLSPSGARFEVCDNGIGFDMATARPTSMGLRIMRERAEAIGADFRISSTPGSGTCLEVDWTENPNLKLRVL
ncbi:MAG TPA: two-component regulator propeller domain-containing protein [Anaerolineales bacterium]|nr:two-component regulator propeller domain-containing protein [Anaerolineales bacterium]